MNQKSPAKRGALFCRLRIYHRDVAGLRSFGSLFNIELDLLTFHQVAVSIALNGGEMDEKWAGITNDKNSIATNISQLSSITAQSSLAKFAVHCSG